MVVLEKTESPLNCKEINPELFIEKTDAEVEAPILWSPDVKSWLTGKDPDAEKDWGHISVPRDQKSRKGSYYPGRYNYHLYSEGSESAVKQCGRK